jgi:hypothetical protein
LFRAYLASDGNDANPCTLAAPCRLLPAALTAVASGGEIWMLDSANYNTATVTISKSVSILAVPGAVGSVVALAGPAILITAPSLTIALRNLVIVPLPGSGATDGVEMTGALRAHDRGEPHRQPPQPCGARGRDGERRDRQHDHPEQWQRRRGPCRMEHPPTFRHETAE